MSRLQLHKILLTLLYVSAFLIFCYFRLLPILLQSVPYTYDQGRDFLKAEEIIRDHNITFIGPTTGILGLFHGVWWYYALVIPYILFQGAPVGFYYFVFLLSLIPTGLFGFFLRREFGETSALVFLYSVSLSPYFIGTAFFPISSVFVLPFLLLFLYSSYQFIKHHNYKNIFLLFLSLGFIFESEIAFGLFLIPAFLITLLLTKIFKYITENKQNLLSTLIGFTIPLIPRLLFEFKNSFSQTRVLLHFLSNPTSTNPVTLKGALFDRINLFSGYYTSLFPDDSLIFKLLVGFFIIVSISTLRKLKKYQLKYVKYIVFVILFLSLLTVLQRNNFFWGNYLEGFPYFYLILLCVLTYAIVRSNVRIVKTLPAIIILIFFIKTLTFIYSDFSRPKAPIHSTDLKAHMNVVDYIYTDSNKTDFCVTIYTPPVIPYTYNYLFNYFSSKKNMPYPHTEFINNKCYFIIEKDDNKERVQEWRSLHISPDFTLIKKKIISETIVVELYEKQAKSATLHLRRL